MPTITLTPGSSASSIISLTFNAGASLGNISFNAGPIVLTFDDPFSYIIVTAFGTYYWATSGGVYTDGLSSTEATNTVGDPITSADKDTVTYGVRGLVQPDFVQTGFNYLLHDGFGFYTWCNSSGIEEDPPVPANPVDTEAGVAIRGDSFFYVLILTGSGK
jgi:hypothetical protein